MPLHCPRCRTAQAEENKTCLNCGQSLTPTPDAPLADPVHGVQARQAPWRLPALIAVGLPLALAAAALLIPQHKPGRGAAPAAPAQAQTPAAVPPVPGDAPLLAAAPALPAVSAPPPAPATPGGGAKTAVETAPLTITLTSMSAGRHVKVGSDVTLTAFTSLARGRRATLTLFYRRGRGRKTMLSFAQGSLCSTTWTPSAPGRYEFMATALGDAQQAAASRPVQITVDRPAAQPSAPASARNEAAQAPPPRPVRLPLRTAPPRAAAQAPRPAPALTYYVAAAYFSFPQSAVVLADALKHRGYPAVSERMADPHGKTVYVVVTGSYQRPSEAHKVALSLQRSGYPAYFFGSR